jgi:hypothetical protein
MKDLLNDMCYFNFSYDMVNIFTAYLEDYNYINVTFVLWVFFVSSMILVMLMYLMKLITNVRLWFLRITSICLCPFLLYGFLEIDYLKISSAIEIVNTSLVSFSYSIALGYIFVYL